MAYIITVTLMVLKSIPTVWTMKKRVQKQQQNRKLYRREICTWMKANALKINEEKTEYIIFTKSKDEAHMTLLVGTQVVKSFPSLVPNKHKTIKIGQLLCDTATAVLWNNLPTDLRCELSLQTFKKHLKIYLC